MFFLNKNNKKSRLNNMKRDSNLFKTYQLTAERKGFEPLERIAFNGFRDRPIRPLWHLSPTFYNRKATLLSCSQRRQRDSNPRYISV